ncbi:MAG TPA: SIMPL domain-containing protein [Actinomycetota bacterium]|nr:SIMPL domain-containing protein [Actinomycetota bacterium]
MRNRSIVVWVSLVVIAAIVGFTANAIASSDEEGTGPNRRISVSGSATVNTRPDEAVVDVGVRSEAQDGATAMEDNATKMAAVLKAVGAAGVQKQDVQTARVSLERRTLDRGTARERTVFVARNTIEVTIADLDATGSVIDAAVGAGAGEVRNVRFQVSNPTEVRRQALEEAVRAARAKADAMAAAAGARVTDVISIAEQGSGYPEAAYDQRLAAIPGAFTTTPILPTRDIQTRVTVSVVWGIAA